MYVVPEVIFAISGATLTLFLKKADLSSGWPIDKKWIREQMFSVRSDKPLQFNSQMLSQLYLLIRTKCGLFLKLNIRQVIRPKMHALRKQIQSFCTIWRGKQGLHFFNAFSRTMFFVNVCYLCIISSMNNSKTKKLSENLQVFFRLIHRSVLM